MKYGLCFLLLLSLSSCYQADSAGSPRRPRARANPLLGHWQCDSVATVLLDKQGHPVGEYRVEHAAITLDVTPTQYSVAAGSGYSDTATSTYSRHGQDLIMTRSRLNRKRVPSWSGKVEHTYISTLTSTVFRTEKTLLTTAVPLRIRQFYHR